MNKLGKWITNNTDAPFYARKQFEVKEGIKKAIAYVCGLGQFVFYINGKKVDDHELDPGWTNYKKIIEYVTFDVKEYLHPGFNVLGAEVGNGWFLKKDEHYTFKFPAFMPPNPNPYTPFGKHLVLALALEIEYEDGTKQKITVDESFQVRKHPVVMSNVFGSETTDGRLTVENWSEWTDDWQRASVVPKQEIPTGKLIEQFQPPIKVTNTYQGQYLHTLAGESPRDIYDFGQNMSGILEFEVKGKAGDHVYLYPAEKLNTHGDVDQMAKDWVEIDSCITYIIGKDDVWETCRMKFTYFAGRYVAVEIADKGGIKFRNLKGHAITSAHVKHGDFWCDDERYMKIYNLVEKAVEANMVSVHTDCPTIERFAWQEPNHLMAPSIFYMKDGKMLWKKFLLDMRTDQHVAEDYFLDMEGKRVYPGAGLMPSQCPCYIPNVLPVPGMGSFYDIIPWGSTCILGTYWHYQFYGDVQIIKDNYDAGMRYLKYLKTRVNKDGFLNHGLGDWGNPKNNLIRENIETTFLYANTVVLSKFATILGRENDKKELDVYATKVKENYNKKLLVWNEDEGFWCYRAWDHPDELFLTQAGQALPLYWGLVPKEKEADVVRAFRHTLECENAFICGEVGLPYVIQTARKHGMNDLISRFITKVEHPSYYAFVLDGETTLGEYWETNPRSHCHDMMGHIIEWYYNGIVGIIPENPGFSKILLKPFLPEGMHQFKCRYKSASGAIEVSLKEGEEELIVVVSVPKEIEVVTDMSHLEFKGKTVSLIMKTTLPA